ncbi:MAG TPA: phage major capsid protein [Kribbellaceae bacterium]|nr:phage major capsid protein [Kribbellaceae bacterium]
MALNSHANDAMIRRLEKELEERNAFSQGLVASAQDQERDLNDTERAQLVEVRSRMTDLKEQLESLEATADIAAQVSERAKLLDGAITRGRSGQASPVEYRSAGHYLVDNIAAQTGSRAAMERLEVFNRAAAHQKTSDNLGVIPDPIVGDVLNFIDASRPLVGVLGPRDMPSATWYRPKVTARTLVGVQGSAGAAADEKAELSSQKMTIARLTGTAVTYGGYVNVSRQDVDFSSPQMLDAVVNDLAAQYAVQTEAALGVALIAGTNNVELTTAGGGTPTAAELTAALWTAAANIYAATKGQGRIILAIQPAKLGNWGSLFAPVNPQNAQSEGFRAGDFGQGLLGSVSGIPAYVSAGLVSAPATTFGIVMSTAAVEVYEQRVGTLQAVEPSVLGVQVAYAGYFTPMTVEAGGIQEIVNLA